MAALYPGFARAAWPRAHDPAAVERELERFLEALEDVTPKPLARFARKLCAAKPGEAALAALFGNSPHLTALILSDAAFAARLFAEGPDKTFKAVLDGARKEFGKPVETDALMEGLRRMKKQAALAIALADISAVWDVAAVTQAISDTAETALDLACRHLLREAARRDGLKLAEAKAPERNSGLVVLGMGKLGARELNYSSDVDIIVLYDVERVRGIDPDEIQSVFVKLVRNLVKIMEARTSEGYVFRTDLRLRPDPAATPMALSTLAAETYYESLGLNWERAAMIKARPVAGDREAGARFLETLRPFVWRRHLDFAAIADIHDIKRQIQAHRGGGEIALKGHNVKVGRGGIREIEFYAQTQQMIWGGRDPALREPATIAALKALVAAGRAKAEAVADLEPAYAFLRTVEHRLQMIADEQTQTLPADDDEWERLAAFMGFADGEAFGAKLRATFETVAGHYARLFEEAPVRPGSASGLVFSGPDDDPATLAALEKLGFREGARIAAAVRGWHSGRYRCTRTPRARGLLVELAPRIAEAFARTSQPDAGFVRFDRFLEALPAGVQLFSLFNANPDLIDLTAEIMGSAPHLAEAIATRVHLLDAVLSPGFFDPPPGPVALIADLARANAQARDFQDKLDIARRWRHEHAFQVSVQLLRQALSAAAAGAALSDIADCTLASLLDSTREEFQRTHGDLPGSEFAVLALGKLGGRELTVTSDLDLVMVYSVPAKLELSDGAKALAPSHYFSRLASRFVTALSVATPAGALYEIDLRLRPEGNKGPPASEIAGFEAYVANDAWTWEHMALSRARLVCGGENVAKRALAAIAASVGRKRDAAKLAAEIADMRKRMAAERAAKSVWQIKDWRGGLVDVEFLVQHAVLATAARKPDVIRPNTADAIAALAAAKALTAEDAAILSQAHALYSCVQAMLRLTVDDAFDPAAAPDALKALLARAAGTVDFSVLEAKLNASAEAVRGLLARHLPGSI
ncbi:MAG: bifunctional [glutamine synthetase] adenylyltransferase/[glutamine synthetase]-adenylyl-L-tyrosine phosphorylase [Alphaproteobacteria bacterium]|nr:bifunctional [glutamine synthetase] adenylyltransferase/[glutamine synthetase]-adenylyl-L-tyrosine phosphorylase [Alphaproteobacteria bacterium]